MRARVVWLVSMALLAPAIAGAAHHPAKPKKGATKAGPAAPAEPASVAAVPVESDEQTLLRLLDQGVALFKANDLGGALKVFSRVHEMAPDKANPLRWMGLVEARLGRCGDAVGHLKIFLERVPVGDARTVEALTVHDACADQIAVKAGGLIVESVPPGAEVRIDREDAPPVGVTPFHAAEIAVGSHVLFLRKAGMASTSRVFTVTRKETVRIEVALQRQQEAASSPTAIAPMAGATEPPPKKSKLWVVGVVVGVVAVAALGVGLGVGLGSGSSEPILPSVAGR